MRTLAITLSILAFAAAITACGGKKYIQHPEERPGQMEPYNYDVRETDQRAPYSVDVPIQ